MNAVMITGDSVGDVMFYGAGAGKLPTASAVVADMIDAVKHRERSKKIFWEKPEKNITASADDEKFAYFIRTGDSAEKVREAFKNCRFAENIVKNESAFITEPLTASEVDEGIGKLSSVITRIRVLG